MASRAFRDGVVAGLPFVLVVGPFGALFGVVAVEAGLTLAQTMAMTSVVIAGASQFAALQLASDGAGLWLIVAGALVVNLRMAMYSAALVPHLGMLPLWQRAVASAVLFDQPYAAGHLRFETGPPMRPAERFAYFTGIAAPIAPVWIAATYAGARFGAVVPEGWPIDFALPITFLALVGPMLRTRAHWAAAGVSALGAVALSGLPAGTGLLAAAVAAMATGALVERWSA
ncbi:MAG: AzlC family ABC transporter permease [Paracoccaceae bacterium]